MRHRLSLLAQQVPVVQAGVRIVNQNARKKQTPPKRVLSVLNIKLRACHYNCKVGSGKASLFSRGALHHLHTQSSEK
ncbi:hypothetical protein AC07_5102 [Escherichia coli 3-475-03_S3_C1]|nr:hypothetical protein AC07_5102 [Escherichia coli 3-475-03_S3_C1]